MLDNTSSTTPAWNRTAVNGMHNRDVFELTWSHRGTGNQPHWPNLQPLPHLNLRHSWPIRHHNGLVVIHHHSLCFLIQPSPLYFYISVFPGTTAPVFPIIPAVYSLCIVNLWCVNIRNDPLERLPGSWPGSANHRRILQPWKDAGLY